MESGKRLKRQAPSFNRLEEGTVGVFVPFLKNNFFTLLMLKTITKYCHEGRRSYSQIPRNRKHSPPYRATHGSTRVVPGAGGAGGYMGKNLYHSFCGRGRQAGLGSVSSNDDGGLRVSGLSRIAWDLGLG